jgi:predicted hydrocarbon binding protein
MPLAPPVAIEIDETTGHWVSDGLPMVFTPRHFFMSMVEAMEAAVGPAAAATHLYDAGFRSAETWCRLERERTGMGAIEVVHFYLERLSQRGWGRFALSDLDPATGTGTVTLHHSSFVAHYGSDAGRKVCGLCAGWAPGALTAAGTSLGRPWRLRGAETQCAAEGHTHCEFSVTAVD